MVGIGNGRWGLSGEFEGSAKMEKIDAAKQGLGAMSFTARQIAGAGAALNPDGPSRTALTALELVDFGLDELAAIAPETSAYDTDIITQIKRDALYVNYIERQKRDIEVMKKDEGLAIPADLDFAEISGLSNELVQKLSRARPANIAQAGRIDGMTPAALTLVLARVRKLTQAKTA